MESLPLYNFRFRSTGCSLSSIHLQSEEMAVWLLLVHLHSSLWQLQMWSELELSGGIGSELWSDS